MNKEKYPKSGKISIKSYPRIRQIYWCRFPEDAEKPEFWKKRPVVIFSKSNPLGGWVTVLPCSTADQPGNANAVQIDSPLSNRKTWVVCDYITTVAMSRLTVPNGNTIPRVSEEDFKKIKEKSFANLPVDK